MEDLREVEDLYSFYTKGYDIVGRRRVHTALLDQLLPDTDYDIVVDIPGKTGAIKYYYKTPPDENYKGEAFNIIYAGDVGVGKTAEDMAKIVEGYKPRAIIIGGDLAYENGSPSCYISMDGFIRNLENNIFKPMNRISADYHWRWKS